MADAIIPIPPVDANLTIVPTGRFTSRGEVYHILLGDELLASGTHCEFTAVRVLNDRGYTGHAYFRRPNKSAWDFRINIPRGSKYTIHESRLTGPRHAKWTPFDDRRVD